MIEETVAKNIVRFARAAPEEIIKAAKEACVHDAILYPPDSYETRIDHGGQGLLCASASPSRGQPRSRHPRRT